MAKYTQTVDEFYESLTQSWTWKRLTEEEKKLQTLVEILKTLYEIQEIRDKRKRSITAPLSTLDT